MAIVSDESGIVGMTGQDGKGNLYQCLQRDNMCASVYISAVPFFFNE